MIRGTVMIRNTGYLCGLFLKYNLRDSIILISVFSHLCPLHNCVYEHMI